jgi:cell division protein FtsQ
MPRVSRAPRIAPGRPSRWKLLLRRGRRGLRPAIWAGCGIGAIAIVAVLVRTATPGSGAGGSVASSRERLGDLSAALGWRVQNVIVEGRSNTPEPLLRAAIGVSTGAPALGFSLAAARARIETLPWVDHAAVERRLPDTLVVRITERRPYAIWQNQGRFSLIDRAGQVLTDQDVAAFRSLPLVVGAGAAEHAAAVLEPLAGFPALQDRVEAAVRIGERRWNLHLKNGTDVLLPEGHEAAALQRLATLQDGHDLLDRPLQAIDLRLPDRLTLRPQPPAPADSSAAQGAGENAAAPASPGHAAPAPVRHQT